MIRNYQPEILSPAGTFSCFLSALGSGADAVYFGGQLFNARAGAGNFSKDEIRETIRLARLYGVRTHLTVNISVKEKEWDSLKAFLHEILPLGIDAVIVQDPAVASYISLHFPEVELHASTQMAVSNLDGVKLMEELGFSRVVLARELSLSEIGYIRSHTDMELEVFVHGALCYSYSGRCLMSSFHGGRSGNRGQCAQPCRMPYLVELEGKTSKSGHFLSLKDSKEERNVLEFESLNKRSVGNIIVNRIHLDNRSSRMILHVFLVILVCASLQIFTIFTFFVFNHLLFWEFPAKLSPEIEDIDPERLQDSGFDVVVKRFLTNLQFRV